jgi:extracellular elastinolytic metalloproteinase
VLIPVVLVCLGWGDAFATLIRQTTEYGTHEEEYGMGAWAANRKSGIRNYVYSANMTSNPSTFKTLDKPGYWVSCASVTETIRNR